MNHSPKSNERDGEKELHSLKNEVPQSTGVSTNDDGLLFIGIITPVCFLYCVGHLNYSIYEKFNI